MQAIPTILSFFVLAAVTDTALAGTYLEQTVTREMSHGQPAVVGKQRIWITPNNIRSQMDIAGKRHTTIVDLKTQQIHLIQEEQREYVSLPLADYQQLVRMRLAGSGLNDKDANPQLELTDQKKEIAGYECQQIRFKQRGRLPIEAQLWVTDQRPDLDFQIWYRLIKAMGLTQSLGRLGDFISQIRGFPILVRIEQTVFDQHMTSTTEVTQIKKMDIDPKQFAIPEGYTQVKPGPISTSQGSY